MNLSSVVVMTWSTEMNCTGEMFKVPPGGIEALAKVWSVAWPRHNTNDTG